MPMAMVIGWLGRGGSGRIILPCLLALLGLYATVYLGAYHLPIELDGLLPADGYYATPGGGLGPCCCSPTPPRRQLLPVWLLLQPRDFINSLQLGVALVLMVAGMVIASVTGQADLIAAAPAFATEIPADAPPILSVPVHHDRLRGVFRVPLHGRFGDDE